MMHGCSTNDTTPSTKEEVHVIIEQARESIEHVAIHCQSDRSRESGVPVESNPMGVVIVRHGSTEQKLRALISDPFLVHPLIHSSHQNVFHYSKGMREREEQREKGTNCGSTQTIRDEG
jgi:hypothetical protein